MSNSRWFTSAALLGTLLFGGCQPTSNTNSPAASSAGGGGTKRIILLNNTDSPFWDAARAGIAKAVDELKLAEAGFSAGMDSNDGTEQGQIEKLRQYFTQADIVAVVISPISATNPAIADELKKLKERGVIIGCFDSDLDSKFAGIREFYVGTNNIQGGRVLGTAAKNLCPEGAQYVQFVGKDSQQNAIERMDGFTAAVGDGFVQKDRRIDDGDRARARDNVRDVIDKFPELNLLVGIWSYNAPAIVDVVREKAARQRFKIVTFDAEQLAIQQMGEGMIDVMVVQNPFAMGFESVRYALAKLTDDQATIAQMFPKMGEPGGDLMDTGLKVVVPDANTPLTPQMFEEYGPGVEYVHFSDFEKWLKSYNLTSS